jgi:hypothetical protein
VSSSDHELDEIIRRSSGDGIRAAADLQAEKVRITEPGCANC